MRYVRIGISLLIFLFIGLGYFYFVQTTTPMPMGASAMIFPAGYASALIRGSYLRTNQPVEGYWTPAPWQVWSLGVEGYKTQYVGVIEGGQRLIYGNYVCDDFAREYWRWSFIVIEDVGDCYYQAAYNPKTKNFWRVHTSGNPFR